MRSNIYCLTTGNSRRLGWQGVFAGRLRSIAIFSYITELTGDMSAAGTFLISEPRQRVEAASCRTRVLRSARWVVIWVLTGLKAFLVAKTCLDLRNLMLHGFFVWTEQVPIQPRVKCR